MPCTHSTSHDPHHLPLAATGPSPAHSLRLELPLKLLIIGHNPSEHSWASGFSYSNLSNNFWKLLVKGSIIPPEFTAADCPRLPGRGLHS